MFELELAKEAAARKEIQKENDALRSALITAEAQKVPVLGDHDDDEVPAIALVEVKKAERSQQVGDRTCCATSASTYSASFTSSAPP